MKRFAVLALTLALLLPLLPLDSVAAESSPLEQTSQYLISAVPAPTVSSVGGEWSIIGLARSDAAIPTGYYEGYLSRVTALLQEQDGVLHPRKYTEYARAVLALTAIGENPREIAGYDLVAPLLDIESVSTQGVNGLIWAILALDAGHYGDETAAEYVQLLLDAQLSDGGWSLAGRTPSDGDLTAMAVQALAPYRGKVANQLANALLLLQEQEDTLMLEGWVQRIVAQCSLGEPIPQSWVDALLAYQLPNGGFCHNIGGEADLMSTEQGFYALVALTRQAAGQSPLYDMSNHAVVAVSSRWALSKLRISIGPLFHRKTP